ncbi:MAG: iron ABC transporter permease [archaeon]|nr:iron ABC transporter permease [archaeon]
MNANSQGLSKTEMVEEYHHLIARRLIILGVCIVGIVIFVGLLSIASYPDITIQKTYEIILNHLMGKTYPKSSYEWWADRYIWNTAMPHAVVAILAGASLAICGTLMQALMGNPLADPYSTGISSGACFGAVSAIVVGAYFAGFNGESGLILNAFLGSLIPAAIIIVLAGRIRMTPATLILLGTAISYFFNSMITYLMVTANVEKLKDAYIWQIGHLDGMTWGSVPVMAVVTIVGSVFIMTMSSKLNVIANGDNTAISLGVDIQKFRTVCLILMALMTSAVVAYTGIIGFVGLVAPHLVRIVIGSDNKFVIPISMVAGAFVLLLSDYISMQLSTIPIGVVTSLIGSPLFFILIVWQSRRTGAIY